MKRKMVAIIVAAMMMTSMTACGTTNSASAKESVPDTEESVAIDTETEEIETEEPTELAESTEKIEATEVAETENTEEEQVASTDKKTQDTSENSTSSKATNNAATESNSTASTTNSSPAATQTPETPAVSTPTASDTTTVTPTPDTTTTAHEHVWVEHLATGHYEEQVVTAAYDEPVYEEKVVCGCGKIFNTDTEWANHVCDDDCIYGYTVTDVQTGTVHHDAVTQTVWVEDVAGWYDCSICGERSILASHNHN